MYLKCAYNLIIIMSSRCCNSKVYVVNCCKYRAKPSLQVVKYQSADNHNITDISYQYAI